MDEQQWGAGCPLGEPGIAVALGAAIVALGFFTWKVCKSACLRQPANDGNITPSFRKTGGNPYKPM